MRRCRPIGDGRAAANKSPMPSPSAPPQPADGHSSPSPAGAYASGALARGGSSEHAPVTEAILPRRRTRNPAFRDSFAQGSSAAQPGQSPHAGQPSPPAATPQPAAEGCTDAALKERAEAMLLRGEAAPAASGHGPAATEATYGLIVTVDKVVRALWTAHAEHSPAASRAAAAAQLTPVRPGARASAGQRLRDSIGRRVVWANARSPPARHVAVRVPGSPRGAPSSSARCPLHDLLQRRAAVDFERRRCEANASGRVWMHARALTALRVVCAVA